MLIKKKSFASDLPKIINAINESDFLSIDAEFSGLGPSNDYIDDLQSRYGKIRASANDYQLLQYGICAFKWDVSKGMYLAKPFYAYLFPSGGKSFKSSASSLTFLRKFNFDFNSWIDDGIPYLSLQDINTQKSKIDRLVYQKVVLTEKDRDWVAQKMQEINEWLQNSHEKTMKINNVNSYQRRLLYQTVPDETNGHVAVDGSQEHNTLLLKKLKDEDIVAVEDVQKNKSLKELESNIGFYKVVEAMVQAKKPVVGHNSLLDLCHTFNSFFGTLPLSINEFKQQLSANLPILFDTKLISVSFPELQDALPQTALGDVYASVSKEPFQYPNIDPKFQSFDANDKLLHSAGYDAFMTGVIFLKMLGVVTKCAKDTPVDLGNNVLKTCLNKLYLMRSDIPFFRIDGVQDMPSRNHIFRIFDFPKEWKSEDIIDSFKNVSAINVKWIDDTSAFVVLKDVTKANDILNWCSAKKKKKRPFSVETYMEYYKRDVHVESFMKRKLDNVEEREETKKHKKESKDCIIS